MNVPFRFLVLSLGVGVLGIVRGPDSVIGLLILLLCGTLNSLFVVRHLLSSLFRRLSLIALDFTLVRVVGILY